MIRLAPVAIAALVALSFSANAGPVGMTTSHVVVRLNDLNLNRPADARLAFVRIERAAAKACGGNPLARTWLGQPLAPQLRRYTLCQEEAVARTVEDLRLPTVVAAYEAKHHHVMSQWADEYRPRAMR